MACLAASRFSEFDMSTAQETAPDSPPRAPAAAKPVLTIPLVASLVMLALLIVVPLFIKNFFVFQLTIIVVYAIAILSLNILTGASGQVSLGHSAFFAVGAYACGIMMEHANIPYPIAIPIAGLICFVIGFLFGFPALRLKGVYLALATFALAVAAPPLFKLGTFEHWTGGVQGLLVTKPDAPFGMSLSQDRYVYYLTPVHRAHHLRAVGQPAELALGTRADGDPRQRDRRLLDGRRSGALQDARLRHQRRLHRRRRRARRHHGRVCRARMPIPSTSPSRCSSAW